MLGRIAASSRGMNAPYGQVEQALIELGVGEDLAGDIDESVQRRLGKRLGFEDFALSGLSGVQS